MTRPMEDHTDPASTGWEPSSKQLGIGMLAFGVALAAIAMTGLPRVDDNEWRLSAYVLDVIQNGRWFCPTDAEGDVVSKPPLLIWLCALAALPDGHVSLFALYWPTAAATVLTSLVICHIGRIQFGWRAGLLAAFGYLASYAALTQMTTGRYDGLLGLMVTLAAWAAYRAWETGRGWLSFWVFAAIGTLVKGPLALVLAAMGLLAVPWEKRSGVAKALSGRQWPGITVYAVICLTWFALAYAEAGSPLIDKLIGRELIGHALQGNEEEALLSGWYLAATALLTHFAPWSFLAVAGCWRVFRRPSADPAARRFERFVVCWLGFGLLLFSVAAHQRGRLIHPLIPAAALLAGQQLSRWTALIRSSRVLSMTATGIIVMLATAAVYSYSLSKGGRHVRESIAMRDLAAQLRAPDGSEIPLTFLHRSESLQVWLNARRPMATPEQAGKLLQGEKAAFVFLRDMRSLEPHLPTNHPVFEVYRWPANGEPELRILSNQRTLDPHCLRR